MKATAPRLTVIIVAWNRREDLRRALERLDAQSIRDEIEIIVVDSGSTDDTAAMVRSWPTPIRLHREEKNLGPGLLRNVAVLMARAPYVTFLDSDAYPEQPDVLERQVDIFARHPETPGASAFIYSDPAARDIWLTGGFLTRFGHFDLERSRTPSDDPQFLSTCFCTYPVDLFARAGGFDSHYGYGMEDADLAMKVRAISGKPFRIDRDRAVIHLMSDAGRTRSGKTFHTTFCYFEFYRHYVQLRHGGTLRMLARMIEGPFVRRELWSAYKMKLSKWQWWLALGWFPLLNVIQWPYLAWHARRNHLADAWRWAQRRGHPVSAELPPHWPHQRP